MKKNSALHSFITLGLGCLTVYLGLFFGSHSDSVSPVWPATGVYIALTYLWGYKQLPFVFLSYLVAKLLHNSNINASIVAAMAGTIQAFVGVFFYRSWSLSDITKQEKFGSFAFKHLAVAFVSGAISAAIGTSVLLFEKLIGIPEIIGTFTTWTFGDALGYLFLCPLMIQLSSWGLNKITYRLSKISIDSIAILMASTFLVFYYSENSLFVYAIFISLVFFGYRNDKEFIHLANFIVFATAVTFTFFGRGPFLTGTATDSLISLQILLVSTAGISLALYEFSHHGFLKHIRYTLFGGFIIAGSIFSTYYQKEMNLDKNRMTYLTSELEEQLNRKYMAHLDSLIAIRSFLLANSQFNYSDWQIFIKNLDIDNRLSGQIATGAIKKVDREHLKEFLKLTERKLPEKVEIKNLLTFVNPVANLDSEYEKGQNEFYLISLIEPYLINRNYYGLDISSEIQHKTAANLARQSNQATLSQNLIFRHGGKDRNSLVLYLPVNSFSAIKKNEFEMDWVFAVFDIDDFLAPFLAQFSREIQFTIRNTVANEANNLVFSNKVSFRSYKALVLNKEISLGQQKWQIDYSTTPHFMSQHLKITSWVLVLCNIIVLLLAGMIGSIQMTSEKAEQKAKALSLKLIYNSQMSALGEMASGIAHEINNPLTVIRAKMDQIKKRRERNIEIDINTILSTCDIIINCSDRIARIISGLMKFSHNKIKESAEVVEVSVIISNSLDILYAKFNHANIEIRESERPKVMIECHHLQIAQVLHNLLTNAYDAVELLEERWIEVEYFISSKSIEIQITDSGNGIPKEIAEKMMNPFFTTKNVGHGIGLGLSECKGIVDSHHGELYLDAAKRNTCFILRLPLKFQEKVDQSFLKRAS
jgi:signal transduction histidine kinase/integral membrane sensor domain MASE1